MKKEDLVFPNDSYTGVFIRPRTVTKLRTLGQLRHRSVAISRAAVYKTQTQMQLGYD